MPFLIMVLSPSVIIRDLDVMGSVRHPDKTDPPLIVDSDAMLAGPIPFQLLQSVSSGRQQVFEIGRAVQHGQFSFRRFSNTGEFLDGLSCKQSLRLLIPKPLNYDI